MTAPLAVVGDVLLGIQAGRSVKTKERPAQPGELGILKVSAVTWGAFRPEENKAILDGYKPGDCPRPRDGDLLISRANTRDLVGAPVLVEGEHPGLLLSDKILRLVPDERRVDRRYLLRALRSPACRGHFEARAGGSSGSMVNITQDDIRTAPLPLPPLHEQRRIAALLDKADAIRRKRQQAIRLADDLLRSAFLDMFGDIPARRSPYPFGSVRNWVRARSGKSSKSAMSAAVTGIPIYGGNGPNGWATRALYSEPVIVVGRVGQQCAITHLTEGPAWVTDNAIVVEVTDHGRLDAVYLATAWQQSTIRATVERLDLPFINQDLLLDYPVPLPPIAVQRRFARFRADVLASKVRCEAAGSASNDLFRCLVQRSFRGDT